MKNRASKSISFERLASTDILHAAMIFGLIFPQFLSAAYDRAVKVQTNNGTIWVNLNDSNAKKLVLMGILVFIAINLTAAVIENIHTKNSTLVPIRVVATIAVIYQVLNYRLTSEGWVLHQVFEATVFWLYLVVADFKEISPWLRNYLRNMIVGCLVINIVFSVLIPDRGTFVCRSDKCGIFGSLWNGFFPHENSFAFFILAAMTMKFLFLQKWSQNLFIGSSVLLILATGSRMALIGALLYFICGLLQDRTLSKLPMMFAFLGVILFVNNTNSQFLTGRGEIWLRIKSQLNSSSWIYGQGMNSFQTGKSKSVFGFALYDEQGTIASNFNRYGFIGVTIFISFIVSYYLCREQISRSGKIMLAVITFAMITESFAMPSVSNFFCFMYFVALSIKDRSTDSIVSDLPNSRW